MLCCSPWGCRVILSGWTELSWTTLFWVFLKAEHIMDVETYEKNAKYTAQLQRYFTPIVPPLLMKIQSVTIGWEYVFLGFFSAFVCLFVWLLLLFLPWLCSSEPKQCLVSPSHSVDHKCSGPFHLHGLCLPVSFFDLHLGIHRLSVLGKLWVSAG